MRSILPSTTALRVFEAAARHLTCTGAAAELCLTQSAVSKQLRALEETLDVTLFLRVNRGLVLTELGRDYLEETRPLLTHLAAASVRLTNRRDHYASLTLRILSIVGDRWLVPRFGEFTKQHPGIDVQFTSLVTKDGQESSEPDAAFLHGDGVRPGYVADYLFGRELVLVAAPALLEREQGLRQLDDLTHFPLLHHFQVPEAWSEFFDAHGVGAIRAPRLVRCEFYATMLKAAIGGMGLALVPRVFVSEELGRGELVNPLAAGVNSRHGYFFVVPEGKLAYPALALLRSWVLREAEATRRALLATS